MSKYTEAIARKIDEENYYHDCMISYLDNESVSEHYRDMMEKASLELEALQIADRLEQADAEEMAIRIGCSKCHHTMCRRNPKYEGEQDLFEVRCDLFRRFMNDTILVLADIRGDNNG